MNSFPTRSWNVLSWNVRGINSSWKWDSVRNKIVDSLCDIVCLQETKKEVIDATFLRKICHATFTSHVFLPSVGVSGGILIAWKESLFSGLMTDHNNFSLTMEFCSKHNNTSWLLTCVYAPCTPEGKADFLDWLQHLQINPDTDWILLGDFNLIRKPEDRNKPGGDIGEMFRFNEALSQLGVNEIRLQGRRYTWSNMQPSPLLQKLDWVFTSNRWLSLSLQLLCQPLTWCPLTTAPAFHQNPN